jgi:L-seryl-tRNA(Ser) seleniumtransferase
MTELSLPALEDDLNVERLFSELGVRPVINAAGAYTVLGGSQLSPYVRAAMDTANRSFVDMRTLLRTSGRIVADMLEADAALVTAGAAASLAIGTAAVLTLDQPGRLERLPDTSGIAHEVLTQRVTRQKYDRCVEFSGAKLVEYGDPSGTTVEQLRAAIGPETAAVHFFVPPGDLPGLLPLEAVVAVAHEHGLPVIVDAAGHTYPLDEMRRYTRIGADLVCYAAKYFDAPHSTGLLVGRQDLIDEAVTNSFIGFETSGYHTIGRPMKVDRQEVFALVVALKEWFAMDHEDRFLRYGERIEAILKTLYGLPGIEAYRISERDTPLPVVRDGVRIHLNGTKSASGVEAELRDGEPSVWIRIDEFVPETLNVSVAFCSDEQIQVVARRLHEVLSA